MQLCLHNTHIYVVLQNNSEFDIHNMYACNYVPHFWHLYATLQFSTVILNVNLNMENHSEVKERNHVARNTFRLDGSKSSAALTFETAGCIYSAAYMCRACRM